MGVASEEIFNAILDCRITTFDIFGNKKPLQF